MPCPYGRPRSITTAVATCHTTGSTKAAWSAFVSSRNTSASSIPTAPATTPPAPSQRGSTCPSSTPQPNSAVASARANPATRCASSTNGRSMSNTKTARVAVIPASEVAKLRASAHPAPPMNATMSTHGKLKRNAQWIAGHVLDRAIAASCAAPSWPARSGWSAPATTASSEPTSRHDGKTTEREKSRIAPPRLVGLNLAPTKRRAILEPETHPGGERCHAADADPARRVHRGVDRSRGGRALVPDRRHHRRTPLLHARDARLRRLLGGARPRASGDRVLPHHRLHHDPRQRVHPRGDGRGGARGRGRSGAGHVLSGGRLLRNLRVRVLRDRGGAGPAPARRARLVERGDRQCHRCLRDGLFPVARALQDRGEPQAASPGRDRRGRIDKRGTRKAERGTEGRAPCHVSSALEACPLCSAFRVSTSALPYASSGTAPSASPRSSRTDHRNQTTLAAPHR